VNRSYARTAAALVALVTVGLTACGSGRLQPPPEPARLILDFVPNAVHSGIYLTHQSGLDRAAGVDFTIKAPTSSSDGLNQLRRGTTQFALLDIHDLAIESERHPGQLVGVLAIVQRPLASVLAAPSITRPRDLQGRKVGVTGLPSDGAVLSSIVSADGGDPSRVQQVQVGYRAVDSIRTGRVAGATGFWNVEGLALSAQQPTAHTFRVDKYGGPKYPELILVTTHAVIDSHPGMVDAAMVSLVSGYDAVIANPQRGVDALVRGAPGTNPAAALRDLKAVIPSFTYLQEKFGMLDFGRLEGWASWEKRVGIVTKRPSLRKIFTGPELFTRVH